MKITIAAILAIIATASVGLLIHQLASDQYSGVPLYYTCITGGGSPAGLSYGWPVNGSLMLIDYYTVIRFTDNYLANAQFITRSLWNSIPKHNLTILDPNAMIAHATDSADFAQQYFLIINQTKWPLTGGYNQTNNFGISQDKIVHTTMSFLNNYPTTYYLPQNF